jgi:phage terminase large subunit-like protein
MSELSSEPRKHSGGQIKKVNSKCGSSIEFMSYEQGAGENIGVFEGGEGNWVLFNEPPPEKIFSACSRWLMVRNGIMMFAMTPLWEAWIYDKLFLNQGPAPDKPDVFQMSVYENPYVSDKGIADLVKDCQDDEIEARIFGGFKHLTGLVYKEFGDIHRIPSFQIPKEWPRGVVMDYHPRTPCALIWYAVDPHGQVFFYDELEVNKTIGEIAEIVKSKEKSEYGRPVPTRWIDSIAATPERVGPKITCALNEFRDIGAKIQWPLAFRASSKNRAVGINAVRDYLKLKNGKPGVYFFEDKCPKTVASFLHYQWGDDADDTTIKNETKTVDNIWAHFMDCVRYALITRPRYSRNIPGQGFPEEKDPYSVT